MRNPFRSLGNPDAAPLIIIVLLASMAVAAVLASQAIGAARERRAISEAMLRQYAQLAAWEFARQARRDIEQSLTHTLSAYAHPKSGGRAGDACDCEPIVGIDEWFEVTAGGVVKTRSDAVRASVTGEVVRAATADGGGMDGMVRLLALQGDATRFIALKPEPHLAEGGQVGLLTTVQALAPVLSRTYSRATLLPAVLAARGNARDLVDLHVIGTNGVSLFSSRDTVAGPHVVSSAVLPDSSMPLEVRASMTPGFIAGLGPAHGAGPRTTLVVSLVVVNALLVGVGVWQLKRERELVRLRSEFVAGVSHELRTPLAQIRMFSETLLLDRVRNSDEKRRALEIIGQESERLTQLVDNVLLFHRRPDTAIGSQNDAIDLGAFVRDVADSFVPLAASKGAQLAVTAPHDAVMVRGNASALRQVVLNLLDNSVKFGPSGQTIAVRVHREADRAVLTVEDKGPGVPAADRQRIFNAFERGRVANGTGGAGIGLAVVRQIVQSHRGDVSVDNTPAGGACFRIVLPRSEPAVGAN
jgi:signal transduction histidine kinase